MNWTPTTNTGGVLKVFLFGLTLLLLFLILVVHQIYLYLTGMVG